MPEYIMTTFRLPKAIYERPKKLALEEDKSLAQVVRESLVEHPVEPKPQPAFVSKEQ